MSHFALRCDGQKGLVPLTDGVNDALFSISDSKTGAYGE